MHSKRLTVLLSVLLLASCGAKSALTVDHLSIDASLPDAFRPDTGPDAFTPDASTPDAFTPDAYRADTGRPCPFGFDDTVDATLRITTDDNYRLFVGGDLVDETPRIWNEVQTYVVGVFRHPARRNTIAVEALNVFRIDGLDRGVVAELTVDVDGAGPLVTDASWRLSTAIPPGWSDVDFDASGWERPTLEGMNGILPWGPVLGSSPAMWLWSYDSAIPASAKPEMERIAVRRDFYIDLTGALRDTPGECP